MTVDPGERDAFAENLAALREQDKEPVEPDPDPPPTTAEDGT
jgi:hypothetical protein